MNFFLKLFVVLFIVGGNFGFVEGKQLCNSKGYAKLNTAECPSKVKPAFYKHTINSDSPNSIPGNQKKRNRKGVKSLLYFIGNESLCKLINFDDNLIPLSQIRYYFHSFSGNEKRGPPAY